jgi:hypothetical protein
MARGSKKNTLLNKNVRHNISEKAPRRAENLPTKRVKLFNKI